MTPYLNLEDTQILSRCTILGLFFLETGCQMKVLVKLVYCGVLLGAGEGRKEDRVGDKN